jgi:hypothetical protein
MYRGLCTACVCVATLAAGIDTLALRQADEELSTLLDRVGAAIERYYARAQNLICLEDVRLQSLGHDLMADARPARRLAYELRVAWEPPTSGGPPEATVLRQLLTVNGRSPKARDEPGCMDPKSVSPEPLAMLLPSSRDDFVFTLAGRRTIDRRLAVMIDYRSRTVGEMMATWKDECFSISLPGRSQGRVWIDLETDGVLRLDEHLAGMFDYRLPSDHIRSGGPTSVTIERLDSSIRYRPVTFSDPDETLLLPASVETVSVVRNSGIPRLRTTQTFRNYQRFLTSGRIIRP